jgi:hypothetical protein
MIREAGFECSKILRKVVLFKINLYLSNINPHIHS